MKYNTKQRQIIIDFFQNNNNKSINAKEIESFLFSSISKATLYRLLDNLTKEGIINKYYNEISNSYEYQLVDKDCANHLHMKCNICGKITHLHEFKIDEKIHFSIDYSHSLLYGTCLNCLGRSK